VNPVSAKVNPLQLFQQNKLFEQQLFLEEYFFAKK
jgi:hypothetical protein